MAGPVFTNNAVGTLAAAYGPTDTSLTLTTGQGLSFPSPGVDEWFPLTIVSIANVIEIVHVTARAGDTFTVLRGQDGTAARALAAGEKCEHRLTAAALNAIRDRPLDPAQIANGSIDGIKLAPLSVTTGKIALGAVGGQQLFQGKFIDNTFLLPGTAIGNLGYTPVEQGGGIGQTTDKVRIGWTAQSKLRAQVGNTDIGYILNQRDDGNPATAGYRGSPHTPLDIHYVVGVQDMGRTLVQSTAGALTFLLSDFAAVPFEAGAVVKMMNRFGTLTIQGQPGVDVLWVPNNVLGPRTINGPGMCWCEKVSPPLWWVYGFGLS